MLQKITIISTNQLLGLGIKSVLENDYETKLIMYQDFQEVVSDPSPAHLYLLLNPSQRDVSNVTECLNHSPHDSKQMVLEFDQSSFSLQQLLDYKIHGYAAGVITTEEILFATKQILSGKVYFTTEYQRIMNTQTSLKDILTQRESQIALKVSEGCSNKEISLLLCISEHTVKKHLTNIFKKLDITYRSQLISYCFNNNISASHD